jgi:hypothetical protein
MILIIKNQGKTYLKKGIPIKPIPINKNPNIKGFFLPKRSNINPIKNSRIITNASAMEPIVPNYYARSF